MTPENDIGQDGFVPSTGTNANQFVGRDAFAYYLSYYNQDYTNLAGQEFEPQKAASNLSTRYRELFNGNIAHMGTLLPTAKGTNSWAGNNTKMSRVLTPSIMGNVYHYDQLNRITKHFAFDNYTAPSGSGTGSWQNSSPAQMGDGKFYESFAYDPNGNITRLARNAATAPAAGGTTGQIGTGPTMDNMSYRYDQRNQTIVLQQNTMVSVSINMPYTNKLYTVNDAIDPNAYVADIDDQGTYNSNTSTINTANNYGYDKLGNLIRDNAEEIASIQWNVTGKIQRITRTSGSKKADLTYGYDASGTRLFKVVVPKQQTGASTGTRMSQEHWDTTWYIKDASGNAMATYKTTHTRIYTAQPQNSTLKKQFFTEELYIYGSNRHGVLKANEMLSEKEYAHSLGQYVVPDSIFPQVQEGVFETIGSTQTITVNYTQGQFTFARGNKQYELSNHLGNVLVTIQDRKWGIQTTAGNTANYYLPYIVTTTDYYAFGSSMVERSQSFGVTYKFGFNNQEKEGDPGSNREGDYYSFEYRIHDSRLGRFLIVDPLAPEYPWNSTYAFAENKVIQAIDLEGLEAWYRSSDPTISNIAPSTNGPELASPEYFASRNLLSSSVPSDYVHVPQNLEPVAYGPLSNEYVRQNNLTLSPAGIPMKFINDYGKFQEYSKEYNFPINTLALNGGASNQAKPVRQWSNPTTPEYSENQATNIYTSYLRANVSVYQGDDDGWWLTMRFYFTTNGPKNVTANQVPSVGIFLNTVVNDEFQIPFTLYPPYTNWPDPVLKEGQAIIKESGVDYLGQHTFSLRTLDPMHDILDIDFEWNVIFNVNGYMENMIPYMKNEIIRIYSPGDPTATIQP